MTTTNGISAKLFVGFVVLATVFSLSFTPAKAATTAELEAQIQTLLAQLAALTGGSTSGGSMTFTMDMTIGSTGAEVTALQNWLIGKGFSIPAGATGYFGAQTQSALAAFQAANGISPAAGYFGPITRAKVNSMGGGTTTPGDDDDDDVSGDLEGGAGSVDEYTLMSGLNNEEVGEDEEDVEIAGLEIEADDGSDLEISAVRLVFDEGTADQDFEDYASEVSIWLDGEEFARMDAEEFNDDNAWTKTMSMDDGAIVRAGETAELTVAVSGVSNLDSSDAGDTWTVDFRQVRFNDADGATISEDPTTGTRTFSFQTFATAADVEFKIQSDDDDINDARTVKVDATDDTDNVDVLSFTMEAEGDSDLELKTFGVSVTVTGASNTDDVLADLTLWIDGEEVASANTVSSGGATEAYEFEDVDFTIPAGETVQAVVKADFISIADALDEGDTISFALGEEQTDTTAIFDIEDEAGEDLSDANKTGSVTSGAFELRSVGIMVTFVSADETVTANDNAADNDVGSFEIVYNVEAFGGDVYVSNDAAPTTATSIADATLATDGVRYMLTDSSAATVADVVDDVDFNTSGGAVDSTDNVLLNDGDDADFTLTVIRTNSGDADDDGLFRVLLKAIGWAATDTTTFNTYDFNLEDFKTGSINLN